MADRTDEAGTLTDTGLNTLVTEQSKDTQYFSVFKAPISNTRPYGNVNLSEIYKEIISDKHRRITTKLRSLPSTGEKKLCKNVEFDYMTVSGTFTKRDGKALIRHSGFICIDVDHIGGSDAISDLKFKIRSIYEPALMFVSPSGDGLKVVFQIDITQAKHETYFLAFESFFKSEFEIKIDANCKDVARATYLCHDPNCFYSETPTIFRSDFVNKYSVIAPAVIDPTTPKNNTEPTPESNNTAIDILTSMIRNAPEGEKHEKLRDAARLAGGYVKAGHIEHIEAYNLLKNEIDKRGTVVDFEAAYKTIKEGIEYGQKDPIDPPQSKTPLMPINGFPDFIQDLIKECSGIYGTHRDLWTAAFMAATATALGQSTILKTKYENPPLFWIAIVGPSGVGKSEPINFAYKQIQEIDYLAFLDHQKEMQKYEVEMNQPKQKGVPKPQKPKPASQNILVDSTPEAMAQAMTAHPRGITIIRDELIGWISDFGRYAKSGEEQNMLSSWSQQTFKVNRKNGENEFIVNPYIGIIGGIQPGLLPELAKNNRTVSGFLPRYCFVFPDKISAPMYSNRELSNEIKEQYRKYIKKLMNVSGFRQEIRLSSEADELYGNFINHNATLNNSGKQPDYFNEVNAKLNVIALRIAVLFHLTKEAFSEKSSPYINAPTMQAAIELSEYFRITGKKVYTILSQRNENIKDVAKYLHTLGNSQNEIANVLKVSQPYINKVLRL